MSSSTSDLWKLERTDADLDSDQLNAKVNIDQPELGVALRSAFGRKLPGCQILGFAHQPAVPREVTDQYVRGDDLVVSYKSTVDTEVDPQLTDQVYWRSFQVDGVGENDGIELVCSLQTDRLDLKPRINILSRLTGDQVSVVRELGGQVLVERVKGDVDIDPTGSVGVLVSNTATNVSFLQALHFTDQESCDELKLQVDDGQVSIATGLYVPHLEKGVIRRARLRASFFGSEKIAEQALQAWFADFSQSQLPLTV